MRTGDRRLDGRSRQRADKVELGSRASRVRKWEARAAVSVVGFKTTCRCRERCRHFPGVPASFVGPLRASRFALVFSVSHVAVQQSGWGCESIVDMTVMIQHAAEPDDSLLSPAGPPQRNRSDSDRFAGTGDAIGRLAGVRGLGTGTASALCTYPRAGLKKRDPNPPKPLEARPWNSRQASSVPRTGEIAIVPRREHSMR